METAHSEKPLVPPYLSYKTFRNFIDALRVTTPNRIDKSVMPSLSGANQSALMKTLQYLKLIKGDGTTAQELIKLAKAADSDRKKLLKEILVAAYPFLFSESFKLQSATPRQMEEAFNQTEASGDTVKKCIAFFLTAAKDADIELSSFLKKMRYTKTGRPTRRNGSAGSASLEDEIEDPPPASGWAEMLMNKFPTFDPAWPDEVKTKWFDGFKQMMDTMKEKE